jgi:AraC-like DNA-binding protein
MPGRNSPQTPLSRSAILNGFAETVISLGGQPEDLLKQAKLPPDALLEQDLMLPTGEVLALFDDASRILGEEDFGLRIAQARPFSTLGAVSLAMREQSSVGAALASLADNVHIQAQGVSLLLIEEGNLLFACPTIDSEIGGPTRQPIELILAALCSLLRQFLGAHWQPHTVMFMHKAPLQTRRHREIFGSEPLFNCDRNALVMPKVELEHSIANSDPVFASQLDQLLGLIQPKSGADVTSLTRELITRLLPQGNASADAVARSIGTTRRTLHRHLAREGTSYRVLLEETRRNQLGYFQREGNLQQQEIADRLGFLSASAFSRWKNRDRHQALA